MFILRFLKWYGRSGSMTRILPPPPLGNTWFEKHNGTFLFFIKHSQQHIDLSDRLTFRLPQHYTTFLAVDWNNSTTSSFPPANWLIFSSVQIASCHNVNYVVDSNHLPKLFLINIRKNIKIDWGHHSCYGYGLSRENLKRAAVCIFQYRVIQQGKICYS